MKVAARMATIKITKECWGNRRPIRETTAATLKSLPPSWWVLSQISSLARVQGVLMPIK